MKFRYILVVLSCVFTFLTQFIYDYIPVSDSLRYIKLADQIIDLNLFDPDTNAYGHFSYPVFLAFVGPLFSYNHYVIGFIQTLIFCLSALYLIRQLEIYLSKDLTALVLILFLVPEIHFFNGYLLTESLAYSSLILAFGIGLRIYNHKAGAPKLFLLSFVIGVIALNRAELTVCIFPLLYLLLPRIRHKLITFSLILISLPAFFLLLNGLRNYQIYQVFKPTGLNSGEIIFSGNNENLDGSNHAFERYKEVFIPENRIAELYRIESMAPRDLYPARDAFYNSLAVEAWKKDPIAQLGVIPEKFLRIWWIPGIFDIYTADTTKTRGLQLARMLSKENFGNVWYAPYKHLFYLGIHWILLSLLLLGIFSIKKSDRFKISVLIFVLCMVLFTIPFCGLPRLHVPSLPLLIIAFIPITLVERVNKILHRLF